MQLLFSILEQINGFFWGGPLLILLLFTHLFFTFRFFPQKKLFYALKLSVSPASKNCDGPKAANSRGLSGFAALSTTLAATLGCGNIVGVSTAIALGGPGALFWCFLTGLLGMATTYGECYLSSLYQQRHFLKTDPEKEVVSGGPMYVLEHGLKKKRLGKFYALCVVFAAFLVGCTTQAASMADTAFSTWKTSPHLIGMSAAVLVGFVILGGMKNIGDFCSKLVPPLSFLYMGACLFLLIKNASYLGESLALILSCAFTTKAGVGGFVGSSLIASARFGIARGLFTNEAGIGTAAIAAGAATTKEPSHQALISMTAVFWDTIVMCTLTGLTIVSTLLAHPGAERGYTDASLTSAAFSFLPFFGNEFLSLALIAFAIATLVGWCYLGEQGFTYLFGSSFLPTYRLLYIVMIYIGAVLPMNLVFQMTDFINALMVFPNVLCLLLLYKKICRPKR